MKILLVNFLECPENLHFEQAFIRALKKCPRAGLDIIHDFRFPYDFIEKLPPPGGRRMKYAGLEALQLGLRSSYDLLVTLDFPKRKACAAPFLRLLRDLPCGKKIFIANHLIPMPGPQRHRGYSGEAGTAERLRPGLYPGIRRSFAVGRAGPAQRQGPEARVRRGLPLLQPV